MGNPSTHCIGMLWDQYTPAVEGQITRDMIAWQNDSGPRTKLLVFTPDDSANRLLNALGIERLAAAALARFWILYQTGQDALPEPENAEEIIIRDLYVPQKEVLIDGNPHAGFYTPPLGRVTAPSINLNKPPPTHTGIPDPMVVWLWG